MRSLRKNPLAASLTVAVAVVVGCSGQADTDLPGTTDIDSGGFDSTGEFASTTVGSGPMRPPGVWLKTYGDSADQKAGAFAVNSLAETAITGSARGTIDFGNLAWTGTATDADVVVAKLSKDGQALWSRRYGDSCDQHGNAVAFTPSGNVLVAGDFCGKMDFGATAVEAAAGDTDVFVALIDTFGDDIYSRRIGGAGVQIARAAAVDEQGNAVLVGSFSESFDDGTGPAASAGLDDIFVLKLDPKGEVLWSQRFGGPEADLARSVALDAHGNVIVGGSFGGSVDFGDGPLVATPGHSSGFLLALDPKGKLLWSKSFGGDQEVTVNGVAVSDAGKIAATGSFTGAADFGTGPIKSAGKEDAFLTLLDSEGKALWNHTLGGTESQIGTGVAFGVNGSLAISGTTQDNLVVGIGYGLSTPDPLPPNLIYALHFGEDGSPMAGRLVGGDGPLESVGIGIDGDLDTFLVGSFQGSLADNIGNVQSEGGWDIVFSRE